MLEIKGLSVNYGHIVAVKDLNLEVNSGEIVALIGTNGAGKTSTLRAISNSVISKRGEIYFEGKLINKVSTDKLPSMGLVSVPEGRGVFPNLSVRENLLVAAKGASKTLEDREERIYELFPILKDRMNQGGWSLSGGEQQMLAMARAIVSEPKMLLLDEPSLGLAPTIVELIFDVIHQIKADGTGILLVEQNAVLAMEVADYVHVMTMGEVVLSGKSEVVAANKDIQKTYLGGI